MTGDLINASRDRHAMSD